MDDDSPLPQHHRRSIRLDGYDYAQSGAYFITLVTRDRLCLFGDIRDAGMVVNAVGRLAEQEWQSLERRFPNVAVDAFQVMPNHIHGILMLINPMLPMQEQAPTALASVVRAYKASVALRYNRMRLPDHGPLWQRNYYEHIIRSTESLERIRAYIFSNPAQWAEDQENPDR